MKKLLFIFSIGISSLFANDYEELIKIIHKKPLNKQKVLNLTQKLEKIYPKAYAIKEMVNNDVKLTKKCKNEYNKSACKIFADGLYFLKEYKADMYIIPLSGNINSYDINVYKYADKAYLNLMKAILNDNLELFKKSLNQYLNQTFFINGDYILSYIEKLKKYYPSKAKTIEKYKKLIKKILKEKNINEMETLYQKYEKTNDIKILQKLLTYNQSEFQKEFLTILLADKYNVKKEAKKALFILKNVSNQRLLNVKNIVLAETYILLKKYDKALNLLISLNKEKSSERILYDLSLVYNRLNQNDKAFEYIKKYFDKTNNRKSFLRAIYKIGKENPKIYQETLKLLHLYNVLLQRKIIKVDGYKFIFKDNQILMEKII